MFLVKEPEGEKEPRVVKKVKISEVVNAKAMSLPKLSRCHPLLNFKLQPFRFDLRSRWMNRSVKTWLNDPLKLYAQSRRNLDQQSRRVNE